MEKQTVFSEFIAEASLQDFFGTAQMPDLLNCQQEVIDLSDFSISGAMPNGNCSGNGSCSGVNPSCHGNGQC